MGAVAKEGNGILHKNKNPAEIPAWEKGVGRPREKGAFSSRGTEKSPERIQGKVAGWEHESNEPKISPGNGGEKGLGKFGEIQGDQRGKSD